MVWCRAAAGVVAERAAVSCDGWRVFPLPPLVCGGEHEVEPVLLPVVVACAIEVRLRLSQSCFVSCVCVEMSWCKFVSPAAYGLPLSCPMSLTWHFIIRYKHDHSSLPFPLCNAGLGVDVLIQSRARVLYGGVCLECHPGDGLVLGACRWDWLVVLPVVAIGYEVRTAALVVRCCD